MLNGHSESFNGLMRDEPLNESLFMDLSHALDLIAKWVAY
jgi:transposase InsO family protein